MFRNTIFSFSRIPTRPFIAKRWISDRALIQTLKKKPINRTSYYDPNIGKAIKLVAKGDYTTVKSMIERKEINVNGHTFFENTLLTDAAKRSDCKAIKFLIVECKANPNVSCDCPDHRTALHYASENNDVVTVKTLLDLGAEPEVYNSRGEKPISVTSSNSVKELLAQKSLYLRIG